MSVIDLIFFNLLVDELAVIASIEEEIRNQVIQKLHSNFVVALNENNIRKLKNLLRIFGKLVLINAFLNQDLWSIYASFLVVIADNRQKEERRDAFCFLILSSLPWVLPLFIDFRRQRPFNNKTWKIYSLKYQFIFIQTVKKERMPSKHSEYSKIVLMIKKMG